MGTFPVDQTNGSVSSNVLRANQSLTEQMRLRKLHVTIYFVNRFTAIKFQKWTYDIERAIWQASTASKKWHWHYITTRIYLLLFSSSLRSVENNLIYFLHNRVWARNKGHTICSCSSPSLNFGPSWIWPTRDIRDRFLIKKLTRVTSGLLFPEFVISSSSK